MDIHSEEFETLLAEALRAGPGSPSWRQAVESLRGAGDGGEEYAMLCRAREDLASGRDFRTVHAGPGFTSKLMTTLDREQEKQWNLPTANIVAVVAVVIVALVVVIGGWLLFSPARDIRTSAELLDTYFVNAVVDEPFLAEPSGFTRLGILPLVIDHGASVQVQTRTTDKPVGGGFVRQDPVAADDVVAIESTLEIAREDTDLIAQVFVSDRPDFAADTGLSPHEFACLVEQGQVRVVLPEGKTAEERKLAKPTGPVTLRIRLNRDAASVEVDGTLLWSGTHGLSADRARFVGVRLLTRGGEKSTGVTIASLKLIKP